MKRVLLFLLIGFILVNCNPVTKPALQPISSSTPSVTFPTSEPTATEVFRQYLSTTATAIQLPFNPKVKNNGDCQFQNIFLTNQDAVNLTEDEIAKKLFEEWLDYFNATDAPLFCKIAGYKIDRVFFRENYSYAALDPKGDFMRTVLFSVKLIQLPTDWMSIAGEIDKENWLHTAQDIAIFKTAKGYRMERAFP